jgi:hypothetical protein
MAQGIVPISNVVQVNINLTPTGVPNYNVNNIILITSDPFLVNPQGDMVRPYTDSATIGSDVGTETETYEQAEEVFAQPMNILAGGGVLYVAQFQQGCLEASGLAINNPGTGYQVGDSINVIQAGGASGNLTVLTVNPSTGAVLTYSISNVGHGFSAGAATTTGGKGTGLTLTISAVAAETLAQAIARCLTYVYFNGIISTNYGDPSTWVALATAVMASGKQCIALPTNNPSDLVGALLNIQQATLYFARGLYYGVSALDARLMAAAYMSWALSVNYNGSNTAITQNLKQLSGILPDPTLTPSILSLCAAAGVDCYAYYGGSFPGVISNGANKFMDEVTNLIWLATTLQVEVFDALAIVPTKIPYTDAGISIIKSVIRLVMTRAVANGYLAPGEWPSSFTFGSQQDFLSNIEQYGFYIYAQAVAKVLANLRQNRISPLVQVAGLEAGAVHQVGMVVNVVP